MSKNYDLIICCGMSRSGSTVQYQIVKHIIESHGLGHGYGFPSQMPEKPRGISVVKSEPFRPELIDPTQRGKTFLLSIHRDPRDVALSLLSFYTKRAEWQGSFLPTWSDALLHLQNAINWHTAWIDAGARSWKYESNLLPSHISAKFIHDMAQLIDVRLEYDEHSAITRTYSRMRQITRINSLDRWMDTPQSLLTRGHLGTGKNKWKTGMSLKQILDVQQIAEQFMIQHGYDLVQYDWG